VFRESGGLVLPTAAAMDVGKTNDRFLEMVSAYEVLHTAGTLHPDFPDNQREIDRLCRQGVSAIKLFSRHLNTETIFTDYPAFFPETRPMS
jgi:hypothetical protein